MTKKDIASWDKIFGDDKDWAIWKALSIKIFGKVLSYVEINANPKYNRQLDEENERRRKMTREDKVTSEILSKQIDVEHKRLGIEVKSEFVWFDVKFPNKPNEVLLCRQDKIDCTDDFISFESWQAYDTAELFKEMPPKIDDWWKLTIKKLGTLYWCGYQDVWSKMPDKLTSGYCDEKLVEQVGLMYLYLLKNGHIKGGSDENKT